jgi:hypothetical protein
VFRRTVFVLVVVFILVVVFVLGRPTKTGDEDGRRRRPTTTADEDGRRRRPTKTADEDGRRRRATRTGDEDEPRRSVRRSIKPGPASSKNTSAKLLGGSSFQLARRERLPHRRLP